MLEALFLFSGGLTMAYMLKLFICLFLEPDALPEEVLARKWRQEGEHYVAPASVGVLLAYLLVMLRLDGPGAAMTPSRPLPGFLGGRPPPMRWTTLPQSSWRGRRSPAAIGAGSSSWWSAPC